jgi:hypothetical protein
MFKLYKGRREIATRYKINLKVPNTLQGDPGGQNKAHSPIT